MVVVTVSHLECSLPSNSRRDEGLDIDIGTGDDHDRFHASVQDEVSKDSPTHVLPSSLLIKSSDIRILDIIGQGRDIFQISSHAHMH